MRTKKKKYRAPICDHDCNEIRRGVCVNCYAKLWRKVQKGETTLEELERIGEILPSRRGHWDTLRNPKSKKVANHLKKRAMLDRELGIDRHSHAKEVSKAKKKKPAKK